MGLSPHTRGKLPSQILRRILAGPIPAYAGETAWGEWTLQAMGAYPRIRGGNVERTMVVVERAGLSPHTRGKRLVSIFCHGGIGPIPAYAGETHGRQRDCPQGRAYPRIRGGNCRSRHPDCAQAGLSPHTRGKPGSGERRAPGRGPIPAYAGETLCGHAAKPMPGAYPRIRGGNFDFCRRVRQLVGLSPHTRGKLASG